MATKKSGTKSKTAVAPKAKPKAKAGRPALRVGTRPTPSKAAAAKVARTSTAKSREAGSSTSVAPSSRRSAPAIERSTKVAIAAATAALEKKAANVEIIDVRGRVDYADYVVVMSGRSDRQVNALAKAVEEHLERTEQVRCRGVEGMPQGSWVLMDFGDIVVHVFHEDMRGYYDLESLWMDAARVPVDDVAP